MLQTQRLSAAVLVLSIVMPFATSNGQELTQVLKVDRQPLMASVRRVAEALTFAGAPLSDETTKELDRIEGLEEDRQFVRELQELIDPLCLAEVHINPESRVKVA